MTTHPSATKSTQRNQWTDLPDTRQTYRYKVSTLDMNRMYACLSFFLLLEKIQVIKGWTQYPITAEYCIDITYWFDK